MVGDGNSLEVYFKDVLSFTKMNKNVILVWFTIEG